MRCPNCDHDIIAPSAFCDRCGTPLNATLSGVVTADAGQVPEPVTWRALQVVLGIIAVIFGVALAFVAVVPLSELWVSESYRQPVVAWIGTHVLGGVIVAVVWFLALRRGRLPFRVLGFRPSRLSLSRTALYTLGALGASLSVTAAYGLLTGQFGLERLDYTSVLFPGLLVILTYQAIAVVTPITEEMFFRGFVYAGLRTSFGVPLGMVISAIVFSVFHLNPKEPTVIIPIFFTGLFFAWLYQRTGSIWPSVAAHAGQNALALTLVLTQGYLDSHSF